jgi:hypothetical protein
MHGMRAPPTQAYAPETYLPAAAQGLQSWQTVAHEEIQVSRGW